MFPLRADEPGWPRAEGGIVDPDEQGDTPEQREPPNEGEIEPLGADKPDPELSGSAMFSSSSSFRRPAIREERPRRSSAGARAKQANKNKDEQRDGGGRRNQ